MSQIEHFQIENTVSNDTVTKVEYKIKIVNSILDNVHGLIGLTSVENEIEKLPIFKRLQYISQLGFIQRIFPGALHTRYLHSLGVLYIADKIAVTLDLNDSERQILRLAGILHDIGHYPFSHDVESVYMEDLSIRRHIKINEHVLAPNDINDIHKFLKPKTDLSDLLAGNKQKKFHHERIGSIVIKNNKNIKNVIKNYFVKDNILFSDSTSDDQSTQCVLEDIASIVVGDYTHKSKYFSDKFTAMVQIIHSELDADNLDYLLRDATFSGTTYGIMDMSILISKFRLIKTKFAFQNDLLSDEHYIVGICPKGIGFVEQFLMNRYMAYSQVIHHKYTTALSAMLKNVIRWFLKDGDAGFNFTNVESFAEMKGDDTAFLKFTDSLILSMIDTVDINRITCRKITKNIIKELRCLRSFDLDNSQPESILTGIDNSILESELTNDDLYKKWTYLIDSIDSVNTNDNYDEKENLRISLFEHQAVYKELTKQIPLEVLEESIDESDDREGKHLSKAMFFRLANGIPIITKNLDFIEPEKIKLIIEDKQSFLHSMYQLKYLKLRKYSAS